VGSALDVKSGEKVVKKGVTSCFVNCRNVSYEEYKSGNSQYKM